MIQKILSASKTPSDYRILVNITCIRCATVIVNRIISETEIVDNLTEYGNSPYIENDIHGYVARVEVACAVCGVEHEIIGRQEV